jgi:antimicrobial peptide system SdpA family protein
MKPLKVGSGAGRTGRPWSRPSLTASDRALGWVTASLGLLATVLALWAVHAAMPANAIQLPLESSRTVQTLLPQGWAFFTADPAQVYPQAYQHGREGQWINSGGSLAEPGDIFGLDRSKRAQGTEMALLMQDIPARDWRACTAQPTACLSRAPVAARLINTSTLQNLCGDVGIVQQQQLPWAWHGSGTIMPSQIVRVEVTCHPAP